MGVESLKCRSAESSVFLFQSLGDERNDDLPVIQNFQLLRLRPNCGQEKIRLYQLYRVSAAEIHTENNENHVLTEIKSEDTAQTTHF